MIGLDTNVLVRYIAQDDARQSAQAAHLIESLTAESPGFLPLTVVVELYWVLSSAYELSRGQLLEVFEALLRTEELAIENAATVWQALRAFREDRADFADCLIACAALAAGCKKIMTFDRGAARLDGMSLIAERSIPN